MDVKRQRGSIVGHGVAALLLLLLGACSPLPVAPEPSIVIPRVGEPEPLVDEDSLRRVMMTRHNVERAKWGAPPLGWDDALVADAKAYSVRLAARGEITHDLSIRGQQGENLWRGTRDSFTYDQMVQSMIDEERLFRPGLFPDVATNARWQDVAHYTQMIWPTTPRLGCATTRGIFYDYLVCRYAPAGNITGSPVGGYVPSAPADE